MGFFLEHLLMMMMMTMMILVVTIYHAMSVRCARKQNI